MNIIYKYLPFIAISLLLSPALTQVVTPSLLYWDSTTYQNGHVMFEKNDGFVQIGNVKGQGITIFAMDSLFQLIPSQSAITVAKMGVVEDGFLTDDGGYVLGGSQADSIWTAGILKLDAQGKIEWEARSQNRHRVNPGYCVTQTPDSGYIAGGFFSLRSTGTARNMAVYKVDKNGNHLWEKTFFHGFDGWASDIAIAPNGDYFVLGKSTGSFFDSIPAMALVRLAPNGDSLWSRRYGGKNDEAWRLLNAGNGNYFIVGYAVEEPEPLSYRPGYRIIKIDQIGDIIWNIHYPFPALPGHAGKLFPGHSQLTNDGGCISVGNIRYTPDPQQNTQEKVIWFMKNDGDGNMQWELALDFNHLSLDEVEPQHIIQTKDGGYAIVAKALPDGSNGSIVPFTLYAKLSGDGTTTSIKFQEDFGEVTISPNPFQNELNASINLLQPATIQVNLVDLTGRRIWGTSQLFSQGKNHFSANTQRLASGIYILQLTDGVNTVERKVVKE